MGVQVGDRIDERYRLDRELGRGGMGAVYIATDERLSRRVALKVLLDDTGGSAESAARFRREALTASKIRHPSVVEIHDWGVWEGQPFLVMELLEGEPLADRLGRGVLTPGETVWVAQQTLAALSAVHAAGVVHRDLKPENLFVEHLTSGEVRLKLLDFGIAKPLDGGLESLTETGAAVGTARYLSPEQATGQREIDGRTDLYALGVILFSGLTAAHPHPAESFGELVAKMFTETPASVATLRPDTPAGLARLIDRCLHREADGRPDDAPSALAELDAVDCPSEPLVVAAPASTSVAADTDPLAATAAAATPQAARRAQGGLGRRGFLAIFGGVGMVAGAMGLVWMSMRAQDAEQMPASTVRDPAGVPAVAPPTPTDGGDVLETYSQASIAYAMGGLQADVQRCYERSGSTGAGRILVHFVIAPAGHVESARVTDNTTGDEDLEPCVLEVVRGLQMRRPAQNPTTVDFPFVFRPAR